MTSHLPDAASGRAQRWALAWIDWYQRVASGRPSPCRFFPSCSTYARDSFALHGARRGAWLTTRRFVRCRPFGPSGFDPVPEPQHDHSHAATGDHPPVAVDDFSRLAVGDTASAHKDC